MININNISKKFGKEVVFKNISFEIKNNERLLIIGPSGSGKTTLIRCLNKFENPNSGNIFLDGINIKKINNEELRGKIGMVFQNYNLFPHLTVLENVTLAPNVLKLGSKKENTKKASELLDKVHILDKKDEYPSTLSGGEKQRVAIARTLATSPEIVLFDEPTSALDPETIIDFIELLKELSKTTTIVVVSHDMSLIESYATEVLFIDDAKIIEYGTPSKIMKSDNKILKSFLGKN